MDIADRAAMDQPYIMADLLSKRKQVLSLKVNGACHYCGEMIDRLFCDSRCEKDYEYEQAAKIRNGGVR